MLATSPYANPIVSRQRSGLKVKQSCVIGEAGEVAGLKKEIRRLNAVIEEKDNLLLSANMQIQRLQGRSSRPMTEASSWRPTTRDVLERPKTLTKTQLGEFNAWDILAERELNLVQTDELCRIQSDLAKSRKHTPAKPVGEEQERKTPRGARKIHAESEKERVRHNFERHLSSQHRGGTKARSPCERPGCGKERAIGKNGHVYRFCSAECHDEVHPESAGLHAPARPVIELQ